MIYDLWSDGDLFRLATLCFTGKVTGSFLLATRLEPAMSHEPRAEQNAKNEAIRP